VKNIKVELESIIFNVMLPESQAFLDELNEEIKNGNEEKEIIEAKKDVVSFIEELSQILKLIEEKKLSNNIMIKRNNIFREDINNFQYYSLKTEEKPYYIRKKQFFIFKYD
jgi:hypothetical protein